MPRHLSPPDPPFIIHLTQSRPSPLLLPIAPFAYRYRCATRTTRIWPPKPAPSGNKGVSFAGSKPSLGAGLATADDFLASLPG